MRRATVLLVLLTGCSTAPVADLLDHFNPGHMEPDKTPPYGGVCNPSPVSAPNTGPPLPAPAFPSAPALPPTVIQQPAVQPGVPTIPPPGLGAAGSPTLPSGPASFSAPLPPPPVMPALSAPNGNAPRP